MIWVFVVASILGGLIAYAGDVIGRKIGRKHLRLFGLRPKTTGLVVAVASGVAVAFASVGAVGIFARDTLENAFRIGEIREELTTVRGELRKRSSEYAAVNETLKKTVAKQDALELNLRQSNNQLSGKQKELDRTIKLFGEVQLKADELAKEKANLVDERSRLFAERNALVKNRDALLQSRNTLVQSRDALQKSRDALVKERGGLQTDRDRLNKQIMARSAELAKVTKQSAQKIKILNTEVATLNTQRATLDKQIGTLETRIDTLSQSRSQLEKRIAALGNEKQELEKRYKQLQASIEPLKKQLDVLANTRNIYEADVNELTQSKRILEGENARLGQENNLLERQLAERDSNLRSTQTALRNASQGNFIFRSGELLSQTLISSDDPEQVRARLSFALKQASLLADQRAYTRTKPSVVKAQPDTEALVAKISRTNGPDLLTVRATSNVPRGGEIPVALDAVANKTLFPANQAIHSVDIDLGRPGTARNIETIQAKLYEMLRTVVSTLRGRKIPLENIPAGVVSDTEMTEFSNRLRLLSATNATVAIVAKQDVTPAGPLQFSFSLTK